MQRKPIEIKISTVVAIAVILRDAQIPVLETALQQLTADSGDYYSEECAVIDVGHIDCAGLDWAALIQLFRTHGSDHHFLTTDADGQFSEKNIVPGSYNLAIA